MTGPDEPDWDFPELTPPSADPSSFAIPEAEPDPIYDTGSDGWWRAQAKAQREAAAGEPEPAPLFRPMPPVVMPPLELIEPTVLNDPAFLPSGPSALDEAYLEPEEVFPALADDTLTQDPERWLAVTGSSDEPVEQISEPAGEPVEQVSEPAGEPVEQVSEPAGEPPQRPVLRPLLPPDPQDDNDTDWDAGPAALEESLEGGVGWRRALAWAALAIAGVGLVIVALLMLSKDEPKGAPTILPSPIASVEPTAEPNTEPAVEPTPTPSVTKVPPVTPVLAPIVPLTVLNNSRISHLAERSAAKFRAGGWPVPATGNYRGQVDTTTIYYPEGQRDSALRFGKQFGVRVLPRFAGLPGSGMTVVVTRDFA